MGFIRRLYDWSMAKAASPSAPWWLGIIAFIESSVFPIPPDALLLPMCLARRAKAFAYAGICTIGSVAGGLFGYALGALFFTAIGAPLIALYGGEVAMEELRLLYAEQGALIVAFAAFTPFPFQGGDNCIRRYRHGYRRLPDRQPAGARRAVHAGGGADLALRGADPGVHRKTYGLGHACRLHRCGGILPLREKNRWIALPCKTPIAKSA